MKHKIISFLFAFFLVSTASVFAGENFSFDFSADYGFLNGHVYEGVYSSYEGKDLKLSMLDWEVDKISTVNLALETSIFNFYLAGNYTYGFPGNSGNMQDYDWLNTEKRGTSELTNYSIHDNTLLNYSKYWINSGAKFSVSNKLQILTYLSFCSENIGFEAEKGYCQYSTQIGSIYLPWSENLPKKNFAGKVIAYSQSISYFGFGSKFNYSPVDFMNLIFTWDLYPVINYQSLDYHIKRSVQFADIIEGGLMMRLAGTAKIDLCDFITANLGFMLEYFAEKKGITYSRSYSEQNGIIVSGSWNLTSGKSSSSRKLYSISAGLSLKL